MLGMSRQEMFDKMVNHLREQKVVSYDDDEEIYMYRGPDGLKCAIGCLIPDNLYHYSMESLGVTSLARIENNALRMRTRDFKFLNDMQQAHDDSLATSMICFETRIQEIAQKV